MAGEVRIGGNTASVKLQGNDGYTDDQTFTFPDEGGELVTAPVGGQVVGYQQGVWEMIWTGNGAVISEPNARWIRIGNQVTCWADVTFPGTANTDTQVLGGLPYNHNNLALAGYTNGSSNATGYILRKNGDNSYMNIRDADNQNVTLRRDETAGKTASFCIQYVTNNTDWTPINGATVS